jgi:uncharacterized protein
MASDNGLTRLAPVELAQRVDAVDTLRGFALLGILAANIFFFAMPAAQMYSPAATGGFTGVNYGVWLGFHLFVDLKMMTIFSMLFGAGLALMSERSDQRAASGSSGFAAIYYRRIGWLFVFGMVHAYALWYGDILVAYAVCGLALYPLRRVGPAVLLAVGIGLVLVSLPLQWLVGALFGVWRNSLGEDPMSNPDWVTAMADFKPSAEQLAADIALHRGPYWPLFFDRAKDNLFMQLLMIPLFGIWRCGGLMLVGMALVKLRVFSASLSTSTYASMVVVGYAVGLPIVGAGVVYNLGHDFDPVKMLMYGVQFNYVGSLFVAAGHVGLVMLVCKFGAIAWLRQRLAAVGRMALTNYLSHTLICTFIFYGWGLGYYMTMDRVQLYGVVLAIWIAQLVISPLWLARFRFGPAEWLWRSLTYWKLQPMRR